METNNIDISNITSSHINAWMVAQTKALKLPEAQITVYVGRYFPNEATWMVSSPALNNGNFTRASSLEEAVAALRATEMTPEQLIAKKREEAVKLLSEVKEMEAQLATAQPHAA